jgi:hypothetical protein
MIVVALQPPYYSTSQEQIDLVPLRPSDIAGSGCSGMTIPNEIVRRVFPIMCPSLPKTIFDLDGIMVFILLEACR